MASAQEAQFARSRRAILDSLAAVVSDAMAERGWEWSGMDERMVPFDQVIQGHTIAAQGLQRSWEFAHGPWLQIMLCGEPPEWKPQIIITSSAADAEVTLEPGGSDLPARAALERVLASLGD